MPKVKSIGGETVDRGTYLDFLIGGYVYTGCARPLPGGGHQNYYKLPSTMVLVPRVAYAVFSPFIGFEIKSK